MTEISFAAVDATFLAEEGHGCADHDDTDNDGDNTFDPNSLGGSVAYPTRPRADLPRAPHAQAVSSMAGIYWSAVDAAVIEPPPQPPAAEGHGGAVDHADGNVYFSPLLDLVERFPELFVQKVLQHLDPIDRTFLAQAGVACRAAVAASHLPRAGTRRTEQGRNVWVVTHQLGQGITLVHFSAQLEPFLWYRGCA